MSDEQLPQAVWEGTFKLCGVDLKCAVLDNGQRVIEAESFEAFMFALGSGMVLDEAELERFARWRTAS